MCECFKSMNDELKAHNGQLAFNLFGNPPRTMVLVYPIETGRGKKKPPYVEATFCPFCGAKHVEAKKSIRTQMQKDMESAS